MKNARIIFPAVFALYIVAVLICCFGRFESLPEVGRTILGIPADKVAHFVMFLPWPVLAWLAFAWKAEGKAGRVRVLAVIFILGCIFAAMTEAGQYLTSYREGDMKDLLADILGLVAGSIITASVNNGKGRQR